MKKSLGFIITLFLTISYFNCTLPPGTVSGSKRYLFQSESRNLSECAIIQNNNSTFPYSFSYLEGIKTTNDTSKLKTFNFTKLHIVVPPGQYDMRFRIENPPLPHVGEIGFISFNLERGSEYTFSAILSKVFDKNSSKYMPKIGKRIFFEKRKDADKWVKRLFVEIRKGKWVKVAEIPYYEEVTKGGSTAFEHGMVRHWHLNGQLEYEYEYKNGEPVDGLLKCYFENGNLRSKETIINTKKHGEAIYFDEDGNRTVLKFNAGVLEKEVSKEWQEKYENRPFYYKRYE